MTISYSPTPTLYDLHMDDHFVRGIMGPFGSGKSVGMCWETYFQARTIPKLEDGFRHSRWAFVRNTAEQLKDTTLKTWFDWFPDGVVGHYAVSDKIFYLEYEDIKAEILFRALDRPDDVRKLLSLELTGAFINEAREIPWAIVEGLEGRVGRYPRHRDFLHIKPESVVEDENGVWVLPDGSPWMPYRPKIIMDTNPPDDDHWWFKLFEVKTKEDPQIAEKYRCFYQPPGVLQKDGRWITNPKAENLKNLTPGYYQNLAIGKDAEWVKVYCEGKYGLVSDGRPVYSGYNDAIHCCEFDVNPHLPVYVGWDYSFHGNACVMAQLSPAGQLRIFKEFVADEGMSLYDFVMNAVKPGLADFGPLTYQNSTGDPAGAKRGDVDEKFALEMLNDGYEDMQVKLPFRTFAADTNSMAPRLDGVKHFMNRLIDGAPAMLLHPRCSVLRKGFMGRYEYERVKVVGDERYKDVPKKNRYSHCFVAGTPVSTPNGDVPIESVSVGDMVDTPMGPKRVTATMSSIPSDLCYVNGLICTPDHPFATQRGFVRADALQYTTDCLYSSQDTWDDQAFIRYRNSTAFGTTGNLLDTTKPTTRTAASICTERSGSSITEKSQVGSRFITRITTALTTASRTLRAWIRQSIENSILEEGVKSIWLGYDYSLLPGTAPRRVGSGIGSTPAEWPPTYPSSALIASIAETNTALRRALASGASVRPGVRPPHASRRESMTKTEYAPSAETHFESTSTVPNPTVRLNVAPLVFRNVEMRRVYDITVEDAHAFYAEGILVSNCQDALQYLCRGILCDFDEDEEDSDFAPERNVSVISGY